jgi:hypothetical protein
MHFPLFEASLLFAKSDRMAKRMRTDGTDENGFSFRLQRIRTSRRRVKVRSYPFSPFHPFYNPVAPRRRRNKNPRKSASSASSALPSLPLYAEGVQARSA